MDFKSVKFSKEANGEFIKVLRKRVAEHFKSQNISRYYNTEMVIKTIFMLCLYFVPFSVLLFAGFTNFWILLGLWMLMGLGMAGIGLSVMHDANHGAYSKNATVNRLLGQVVTLVGGSALNWRIQHNVLHHSFTNIPGVDEDMNSAIMRFSPEHEQKKIHKFQHIYAWFLYGLLTLSWAVQKDFGQLARYVKMGLTKTDRRSTTRIWVDLIISKVFYWTTTLVLPMILLDVPWWHVLVGFFSMHFVAGFILSCIFQSAHIMPECEYPMPAEDGSVENNWAVHQLMTTANFSPNSRIFSWYVGGLNYQIEHHLFSNICHIHYKKLSKIVQETAQEYGLPYHSKRTFLDALKSHGQHLRNLGNAPAVATA